MTRHLLDIDDLDREELETVLSLAERYKREDRKDISSKPLAGKTLGMLFQRPSTRTRVSFETGMTKLGGHAVFLGEDDIHLGSGEPIRDTARALSQYVDAVMARVADHDDVETMAEYASVPVINALTDRAHPCQTLADLLTIREHCGGLDDVSVTWIGDGNNVARSFAIGCALAGIDLTVSTPAEYGLGDDVLTRVDALGGDLTIERNPATAVDDADVVYTDVWVSMGQEAEREERLDTFGPYQLNSALLTNTADAAVMHCLPAHRGEEITDAVIESDQSIVWQQAQNRMHAQNGLLVWLDRQCEPPVREHASTTGL